jgi:hypothetical protein
VLVAELAQGAQELGRHDAHAALAHDRLDQERRRSAARSRALVRFEVGEGKSGRSLRPPGPKPSRYFFCPPGGERARVRPVEGALEGDDAEALGPADTDWYLRAILMATFHRLGAGIAEERRRRSKLAWPAVTPAAPASGMRIEVETCQSFLAAR